jgi:hypothetical protein
MLVKQNSIFCAIYFMLLPFHICANWLVKLTPGKKIASLYHINIMLCGTQCGHYAECHYVGCLYAQCLNVVCRYAQYPYVECHYAQYPYVECHYAEF